MRPKKIAALVLGGVAAADLLAGNTDHPILPDMISNHLTQQTDMILIAIAVILWIY